MTTFSQSLCFGEKTLQDLEQGVCAEPISTKTPNRSNASDSDIIEESPTSSSTVYSFRERTRNKITNKSKIKIKKIKKIVLADELMTSNEIKTNASNVHLPNTNKNSVGPNSSLSQFFRSEYDFNDDFVQLQSKITQGNSSTSNSKVSIIDDIQSDQDMFDESIPRKNYRTSQGNNPNRNTNNMLWDDSIDINEFSEENCNALEMNLRVDEHIALGLDNVTFTQNVLNEPSLENDLNLKNGSNAATTSKYIEEEMESCRQSLHDVFQDEIQALIPVYSQTNVSNLNASTSSLVLNYSGSSEENVISEQIIEKPIQPQPLKHLNCIASWGLPSSIVGEYHSKGIINMFDWQKDCLSNSKVLFENANLVYCAPTSAGKTLVSEILMIKNVLEKKKKVLIILPFVSVVREKMIYLQDLLTSTGIQVEGYFGGYSPRSFDNVHVAVCTIEKANSIVNKLLEQNKIDAIGCIVVDEVHLISDPSRGYIVELLLAKILYVNQKYDCKIQVITMSATLPNLDLLTNWLGAEFYHTDYRPVELKEMIKINNQIFDNQMILIRSVCDKDFQQYPKDQDNIGQLCVETILENCSVVVFCPSKDWCESLATHLAGFIYHIGKSKTDMGKKIQSQINMTLIEETKAQLRNSPSGLDAILEKTLSYGCAFHHAGLTSDERDIIENAFKLGSIRAIIATSTLSSGVNLPARRVIIRTPLFGGKTMNSLTYKQMIGRAGRTGKDTLGESIVICNSGNRQSGEALISATLKPLTSCLDMDNCVHLKRAILEIIASGMASTKSDLETFCNCTLLSSEKQIKFVYEVAAKEPSSADDNCTDLIGMCMQFLLKFEFIRLQLNETTNEIYFVSTRLGNACLASSMPPGDGFLLFSELQKSRQCFVLETELHAIYLVTPFSVCHQMQDIDWMCFLDMWEKLPASMRRVGELVGVKESFFVRAMRGHKLDYKALQIHKRFYTSLALHELVSEKHVTDVALKFKCSRGLLQSLQQMASTFAGIVTSFCNALNWTMLATIIAQFKERLFFGVHQDLIELMKIPNLNSQRARSLFNDGIKNLADLANSDVFTIEKILYNSICFDSKQRDGENQWEAEQRNNIRYLFVTGKSGLTIREAAKQIIENARKYLELEMGVENIVWSSTLKENCITSQLNTTNINTKENMSSHQSLVSSNFPNDRKRTGNEVSQDNIETFQQLKKKSRCRKQISEQEILSDQFTVVRINSTLSNAIAACPTVTQAKKQFEKGTIEFSKLNIINVFGSMEFFSQFKETLTMSTIIGLSVGVNRFPRVDPIIGGIVENDAQNNDHNVTNYNCTFDNNKFIVGISLCLCDSTVYYLNFQNEATDDNDITFDMKSKFLLDIFHMEQLSLVIVDAKEQCKALVKCFPELTTLCVQLRDPRIANWLLHPDVTASLLTMVRQYAPHCANITNISGIDDWHKSIGLNCKNTASPRIRCSTESFAAIHILKNQMEHLKEIDSKIAYAFTEIEMPIQRLLFIMETVGFPVDNQKLSKVTTDLMDAKRNLEKNIFRIHGQTFNISSSKEVAKVLGLYNNNQGSSKVSTSKQVLEKLNNTISDLIMQHRTVETTLTKIIQPFNLRIVNNRIHPRSYSFTSTGRISMAEPNLQNVTKDFLVFTAAGSDKKIISCRHAFQVCPENQLISADFCQLELRILTHFSGDQSLTEIMKNPNCDIFRMIAAKWNNIKEAEVTDKLRNNSKQICYGIIYGMGVKALASSMDCPELNAQLQQDLFYNCYPGLRIFSKNAISRARECGFVETIFGRRRYLPHIVSDVPTKRAQAERQALNTIIQGSAADIAKCAMLEMDKYLRQNKSNLKNVNLVLHLHDELIYEVPKILSNQVAYKLKSKLESCTSLNVPLRVKLAVGEDWGALKPLDI